MLYASSTDGRITHYSFVVVADYRLLLGLSMLKSPA